MDCVSPILQVACRLWDCTSNCAVYICELPQDLDSLTDALKQLKDVYADVKEKVEREEKLQKKRTHAVEGWVKSVEAMEKEVDDLVTKGRVEIQKKCLGTCCPKNCLASYKMGKVVHAKMKDVASKRMEGQSFSVVAESLPTPPVIERPLDEMVGVHLLFNHVCMQLQDEKVTKLGLYGMGGVGKTTLLNKINNEFLRIRVELDVVIWVTVSRPADVEKMQQVIFKRLGIPDTKWDGGSEDQRKEEIFNVLKAKKFVLLLDDVWEALDLLAVGIPPFRDGSKSKMVLTTRDLSVCGQMGAKAIEVSELAWADAFPLFQKYVGEDTIDSHPHIKEQAEMAAKECDGLPLALIVIGRAMAAAKTPEEWDTKLQLLRKYPDKFPGMEKHLFTRLAFSYDSLQNEATKMCFLYCSLFPEDYKIHSDELIQLWIGEGFLDEYNDIKEARKGGKEIIATLSHACLLQEGTHSDLFNYFDHVTFVKMHDVIRDMALWLACRDGNRNGKKFVVIDRNKLVTGNEIEKWKGAQRISLFGTGFEEHLESTHFPELQTLMLCNVKRRGRLSFPSGFFNYMPNITVLNFAYLRNLYELPVGIDELSTLQYLNLTATEITRIPKGLRNLKRLRCLILDQMSSLGDFPSEIISGLSSLQLFSFIGKKLCRDRIAMILEELEGLKSVEEVSINLSYAVSIEKLMNSLKLRTCLKFLSVSKCEDISTLQLPSLHLEKLYILTCRMLEDVVVMNFENEGAQYSPFPRHHSLSQLSHVVIDNCEELKRLTLLAYAPNLKFLLIKRCLSLREVIPADECGTSEIRPELEPFLRLSQLRLGNLQNLRSISKRNLLFPSLKTIHVVRCPELRKLPFDSNIIRRKHLEEIVGQREWWEQLEWEDETIKHHLTPYYKPLRR